MIFPTQSIVKFTKTENPAKNPINQKIYAKNWPKINAGTQKYKMHPSEQKQIIY